MQVKKYINMGITTIMNTISLTESQIISWITWQSSKAQFFNLDKSGNEFYLTSFYEIAWVIFSNKNSSCIKRGISERWHLYVQLLNNPATTSGIYSSNLSSRYIVK